jgi:uncharacterized protein (TIGR02284 family)
MPHIEKINKLLKDELAATETYQQALDLLRTVVDMSESDHLLPIYENHKETVTHLQDQIRQLGGTPVEDSGAWGIWAKIVLGGANILGKEAVLKALQEGEINGVEDYKKVLEDIDLPPEIRALIDTKLLPTQKEHIKTLERLLETTAVN